MAVIYCLCELGEGQAGADVFWRVLDPAGDPLADWSDAGVVETGVSDGQYMVVADVGSLLVGRVNVAVFVDDEYVELVDGWFDSHDREVSGTTADEIAGELVGTGFVVLPEAELEPGMLRAYRATTWVLPAIDVGTLPADRTKLWWTVKVKATLPDDRAMVQIEETAGLVLLDGAAVDEDDAGLGSLTYDDANVLPRLEVDASTSVESRADYVWDVKYRAADGANVVVAHGELQVVEPVTHSTE